MKIDLSYIKEAFSNIKVIKKCPHCESIDFVKFGKINGIQRYRCKSSNCNRTFTAKTGTIFSYSKKESSLWVEYLKLMEEKVSLRKIEVKLNISLATAFSWRKKINEAFSTISNVDKLKGTVELAKNVFQENFKGQRNIQKQDRDNIIVVSGVDSVGGIISKPIGRHCNSIRNFKENFYNHINKDSFIISYSDRVLAAVCREHNKRNKTNIEQARMHLFSSLMKGWMRKFRGIATKYLISYLAWYTATFKNEYDVIETFINKLIMIKIN